MPRIVVTLKHPSKNDKRYTIPVILRGLGMGMTDIKNNLLCGDFCPTTKLKVYYANCKKTVVAFETVDTLIMFNTNRYSTWDYIYSGPSICLLKDGIRFISRFITDHSKQLEVLDNSSDIPEVPWYNFHKPNLLRVLRDTYDEEVNCYRHLKTRIRTPVCTVVHDEVTVSIGNATTLPILNFVNFRTDTGTKTIDLFFRCLAVAANVEVANIAKVQKELSYFNFLELHVLFKCIEDSAKSRELLLTLGATLYTRNIEHEYNTV